MIATQRFTWNASSLLGQRDFVWNARTLLETVSGEDGWRVAEATPDESWNVPPTIREDEDDFPPVFNEDEWVENKYNPSQPRDSKGRWSSGGGGGGFSRKGGEFDPAAAQHMSVPDRVNAWEKLPVRTRDELADAENSVPKRIAEHLSGLPDRPNTGDLAADLDVRCEHFKDRLIPESQEKVKATVRDFNEALKAANIPEEARWALAMEAADHLAAQDLESYGRQLGDHGIHHIQGNIEAANDCLNVLPQAMSPKDYVVMQTATIFHDAGYLTPPSQNFLDEGHPRWSQDHYESNVRPIVESALGKSAANEVSSIIRTHDQSSLDWENEPVASACRVADNMALFQKEKLPPVFRADADNIEALKALGRGEIDQVAARDRMKANIAKLDLPDQAKVQLTKAVDEVTPVTYKFTIGMLGGIRGKTEWDNDHLKVELRRDKSMDELHKLGDFGQKQFAKFAKSYGIDPEQFTRDLNFKVEGARGKTLLEAVVNRLMGCLILGDFPPVFNEDEWVDNYSNAQPRDDHGRWSSGGGGGVMAPDSGGSFGGGEGSSSEVTAESIVQDLKNNPPKGSSGKLGDVKNDPSKPLDPDGFDQEDWADTLSDEQKKAIREYTEADFGLVNGSLRETFFPQNVAQASEIADKVRKLDASLTAVLPHNVTVYRATTAKGSSYKDDAFVSTTEDRMEAENFVNRFGGKVQTIVVPAGTKVAYSDPINHKAENEIILPRGGSFKRMKVAGGKMAYVFSPPDGNSITESKTTANSPVFNEDEWVDEPTDNYNPSQPRDSKGRWGSGGGTGVGPAVTKSERAKASAVRVDSDIQRYAEEYNEPVLAKALGGKSMRDNEPVDMVVNVDGKMHGIELKTMTVGVNRKLTMKGDAIERKRKWERKNKATAHTVVFDDTEVYGACGSGCHDESKRKIYYRRGYGSFRVDGMMQVGSMKELKGLLNKTRRQLPKSAGGTKKGE